MTMFASLWSMRKIQPKHKNIYQMCSLHFTEMNKMKSNDNNNFRDSKNCIKKKNCTAHTHTYALE